MDLKNITVVTPKNKNLDPKRPRVKLTFQQQLEMVKGVQIKRAEAEGNQRRQFSEEDSSRLVNCPGCGAEIKVEIVQGKLLGYGWVKCKPCRKDFHVDECASKPK